VSNGEGVGDGATGYTVAVMQGILPSSRLFQRKEYGILPHIVYQIRCNRSTPTGKVFIFQNSPSLNHLPSYWSFSCHGHFSE